MNHHRRWTPEEIAADEGLMAEEAVYRAQVDQAAGRGPKASGKPKLAGPFFSFADDAWDEAEIEPRPWLAPGYLMRRTLAVLVGPGAAGKSSLFVSWTIALALGQQFNRMKPAGPFRVVTVNTEDDDQEQRRRFSASLRSVGRTPKDLVGKVLRVAASQDAPLFARGDDGIIGPQPAFHELVERLVDFGADVLILDPLISLHVEDENSNEGMRGVVACLRQLARDKNIAVLVAHHTKKGILTPGNIDDGRGASAVKDLARIGMTLTVMTEEDAKTFGLKPDQRNSFFRVDDGKMNYAPMQTAEWFERQAHKLDNGDWVACAVPWMPPEDVVTPDMRETIRAGLARGSAEGPYSPKLDKSSRSFKALCLSVGIVTAPGQKAMLEELLASGGYVTRTFKRASSSTKAQGIRCPDGSPRTAAWIEDETDYSGGE